MIRVDAHVHVYDCFDAAALLGAAAHRLLPETPTSDTGGILFLTESAGCDWFKACADTSDAVPGWTFRPTAEPEALLAQDATGRELAIVAGRQVACREGLEVLALGTLTVPKDDLPIREVLQRVHDAGALSVIPWGVGKWFGARGRLVAALLDASDEAPFYLGDNAGRPLGWPRPRLMAQAEQRGVLVLPGSDPLPFPGEESTVARCGFHLEAPFETNRPLACVRAALERGVAIQAFGTRELPLRFVRNQVAMQWRKRRAAA